MIVPRRPDCSFGAGSHFTVLYDSTSSSAEVKQTRAESAATTTSSRSSISTKMAIVMSSRSKIVVGVIILTFLLAAVLVVGSTAGWFHNSQMPMPAPHPLQHSYAKRPMALQRDARVIIMMKRAAFAPDMNPHSST
ncbi:hypothetical protein GE061_003081 [Apolygus lucorum]|uniref:Uncharacterized protein n=1 Tax=Apolygus lucorum TaxID=248454 RepID=A0A8S9X0I2_APOLU|nr:hypothetical protein GE061_003081 [Apolygus lucorum]